VLRRVRAALIIITVWILCWVPFGVALDHVLADILVPEPRVHSPYTPVRTWAVWGALTGLGFVIVLGLAERGRQAGSLSILRVLSWGAVGSALLPVFYQVYAAIASPPVPAFSFDSLYWRIALMTVGISALLGVVCALGTLALMRVGRVREPRDSVGAA
jgi:hypothetical protein